MVTALHSQLPFHLPPADSWMRVDLLAALVLAAVLGAVVGWEREVNGKPAGLRTTILICVGAALFTDLSLEMGRAAGADPSRIASQIVTGIGFLGAGSIIQSRGHVSGLTTAATIWVVAAIGVAAGAHARIEAVGATVLVLLVLVPLSRMEELALARRRSRHLVITAASPATIDSALERLDQLGLRGTDPVWGKDDRSQAVTASMVVTGPEADFRALLERLARQDVVLGLRVS